MNISSHLNVYPKELINYQFLNATTILNSIEDLLDNLREELVI